MATRSHIIVKGTENEKDILIYKHWDGYPSNMTKLLPKALEYSWDLPRYESDEFACSLIAALKIEHVKRYEEAKTKRNETPNRETYLAGDIRLIGTYTNKKQLSDWAEWIYVVKPVVVKKNGSGEWSTDTEYKLMVEIHEGNTIKAIPDKTVELGEVVDENQMKHCGNCYETDWSNTMELTKQVVKTRQYTIDRGSKLYYMAGAPGIPKRAQWETEEKEICQKCAKISC